MLDCVAVESTFTGKRLDFYYPNKLFDPILCCEPYLNHRIYNGLTIRFDQLHFKLNEILVVG